MNFFHSFLFLLFSIPLSAQVTIGSAAHPTTAALLQLKSHASDENNVTSSTGGIVLSRVSLTNLNTLEPFISPSSANYETSKREHTGLFVFNVNSASPFVPGLYFWDGQRWNILMASPNPNYTAGDTDNEKMPEIPRINNGLTLPNSYIIKPGATINIPVMKAYSVWKLQLDNDISMSQHEITTELLWQDEKEMVAKVSLIKGNTNEKSVIQVKTTKGIEGNAVVAVKMDGVVRWSWHIWITDYNPQEEGELNICDKATFMNRYLGATSASQGHVGSIGLLYQWGRKDPFSSSSATATIKEKVHYSIDNKLLNSLEKKAVAEAVNLPNSIINPQVFYMHSTDWYSNNSAHNNYLWTNTDGSKGVYDPCPEGWRVPNSEKDSNSVWSELQGKGKHFDKGKGVEWEGYGYYQASGRRNGKGELEVVGSEANVWSAKNFFDDQAYYLGVADWNVYPQHMTKKVYANSIRCVKEK